MSPTAVMTALPCFASDRRERSDLLGYTPTEKTPRSFDIDPSGRWLFAAGEGSGKLAGYRIDAKTGDLLRVSTLAVGPEPWCVLAVRIEAK